MKGRDLLFGLLLLAGAAGLSWWALREKPQAPSSPAPLSFEAPPAASGGPDDCYFNWASDPLPDLSEQVQSAIQEVQSGAQARAEAFGETCTYSDGRSDFRAMETDFFLTLQAADLEDSEALGGLVRRSMELLLRRFPPEQTPGPLPGRVTFIFTSPAGGKNLNLQITDYQNLTPGLSDSQIFRTLFPD